MQTNKGSDCESQFGRDTSRCLWKVLVLILGDRISKSDYELRMGEDVECAHLCDVSLDQASAKQIYDLIHDEYLVEW